MKIDGELLLPAGSFEALETALYFGADAVYVGGPFMQLRANAASFDSQVLIKAVEYTHGKGKKLYVAVNCFAENGEIEPLGDYAKFLLEIGVDAAIVSDLGAIVQMKSGAADLPVHVSTQANIQNYKTAEVYYNLGAERVVLGREMTLEQIGELRARTPKALEIECFVHGAMCMAYSGRCLLSQFMTGKSGNRGECTQPCRWNYKLVEQKRPDEEFEIEEERYNERVSTAILSSHDLCAIDFLDNIAAAGVDSFKVEGRMKSPFYVATVGNAYRKRMDGLDDEQYLHRELECASHRPYSSGFYFNDERYNPLNDGQYHSRCKFIATVKEDLGDNTYLVEMRNRFTVGDTLEILSPKSTDEKFTVEEIVNSKGLNTAVADLPMERVKIKCDKRLYKGDFLRRKISEK